MAHLATPAPVSAPVTADTYWDAYYAELRENRPHRPYAAHLYDADGVFVSIEQQPSRWHAELFAENWRESGFQAIVLPC